LNNRLTIVQQSCNNLSTIV